MTSLLTATLAAATRVRRQTPSRIDSSAAGGLCEEFRLGERRVPAAKEFYDACRGERETSYLGLRAIELATPSALVGTIGMRTIERREEWLEATTKIVRRPARRSSIRPAERRRIEAVNRSVSKIVTRDHWIESSILEPILSPVMSSAGGSGSNLVSTIREITVAGGTSPTLGSDTTIVIPEGHDSIMVWVGNVAVTTAQISLYANVSGAIKRHLVYPNRVAIIAAAAGSLVAFKHATRNGTTTSENAAGTLPIKIATFAAPEELDTAAPVTGTITADWGSVPVWSPAMPHFILPAANSFFEITAETFTRVFEITERDDEGNWTNPHKIRVPANATKRVACRYREVSIATCETVNGDQMDLDVALPTGSMFVGSRDNYDYWPTFTVVDTIPVADDTALTAALTAAEDGDDLVLASGTYSASHFTTALRGGNAYGKSIRIRSATGDSADVTFDTFPWQVSLATGKTWIIQAVTVDLDGVGVASGENQAAVFKGGTVHVHGVTFVNPPAASGSNQGSVAFNSTSVSSTHYLTRCSIAGSTDDALDCSILTAPNNLGMTLIAVGVSVDGNGPDPQDQLVTCHTGASCQLWCCTFKDDSATANTSRLANDNDILSQTHLLWCVCDSGCFANAVGLSIATCASIVGCYFAEVSVAAIRQGHIVYTEIVQKGTAQLLVVQPLSSASLSWSGAPLIVGSKFTAGSASGNHTLDIQGSGTACNVEFWGCWFAASHASNGVPLRIITGATGTVLFRNCRFTPAGSSNLIFWQDASAVLTFQNCIFGGGTTYSIASSATNTTNVCTGSIHQGAKPSNWDTRVGGSQTGTVYSTTPAMEASGQPTASGNCDATGIDLSVYGGVDVLGHPLWMDATPQRGAASVVQIPSTPIEYSNSW